MSKTYPLPHRPLDWAATPHDFTGDNVLGIYTTETTQRYVYGTRYLTWDGRVYKYCGITTNGCTSYIGVSAQNDAITGWTTAVAASAGDREFVITDTSIVEDRLAGAMVMVYNATIANSVHMFITGNEKDNGTNVRVYLEFPLPAAVTTSDSVEVFENPYRSVEGTLTNLHQTNAFIGVPCVTASTGYNVWVQTWGPCIASPSNSTLDDAAINERMVVWTESHTFQEVNSSGVTAGYQQYAGYILNSGTGGIAGPQVYLMCSI